MQWKSDRTSKLLIPGALILFLVPTFVLALNKEISLLREAWSPPVPMTQQQLVSSPLGVPSPSTQAEIGHLIHEAIQAEVQENFDLTLSLINLLLASLAVVPVVSGFFLWSLKKQVENKLIDQSAALVDEKIRESEALAKQKIQELIDARTAELETLKADLETLKIDQILRLINFSIKEDIHPMIEEEYRVMFQQAFVDGFPAQSFIDSISRETKQRLDEYVQIFQSLVKTHPSFFRATDYVWLADACFILSQYQEASQFYSEANRLNPHSFRILHRLGNGKLALKNYQEAIHCYLEAIRCTDENSVDFRSERHAWLFYNLGKAYYQLYDYEEAIRSYQQAYQYNSRLYHSFYWQGNALCGLGQFVEAIDCYRQADLILTTLKASDQIKDRDFKTDREWILHSTGDAFRKIGDSCHQLIQAGTVRCDWLNHHCKQPVACQQRIDYYQQAIDYYNQAEQINSNNIETLHKRGKAYRELGDYKRAEADYRRAIALATEAGNVDDRCNLLANMANLLNRLAASATTSGTLKPSEAAAETAQEAKERFAVALEQCQERRLKARTDSPDILEQFYSYFDTARCYSLKGEVKRADEYMKDAVAHCPPEKQALVQQWANSDADFNNWYWYAQSQSNRVAVLT